jgi:hypothetical protein
MGPMSPRCTPSGLMMTRVRSTAMPLNVADANAPIGGPAARNEVDVKTPQLQP